MARPRSVTMAALNITIHPHSPQRYMDLLKQAENFREPIQLRGDTYGMIGSLHRTRPGREPLQYGLLYRFLQLDPSDDWFNLLKQEPASTSDLKNVAIPRHLKPHFKMLHYVFIPSKHTLFFETQASGATLGTGSARKLFDKLLNHPTLEKRFGPVDVTILPTEEATKKIFKISKMTRLDMVFTRPNSDDLEETEKDVLERLDRVNARREENSFVGTLKEPLKPDEEIRTLAEVAKRNGYVSASGKDEDGQPVEESTEKHPWKHRYRYDPDVESPLDLLIDWALRLVKRVHGERNR